MNLFVALPCYDGKVHVETARSLLNEQALCQAAGIEFKAVFLPGCSLITMARNQCIQDFVDSDADKLIFVDSDVSWEAGDIVRLATHQVDLVGGAYRLKQEEEAYPVGWLDKPELWIDPKTKLLEVESLPGGFLCLNREMLRKFRRHHGERSYSHYKFSGYAYFDAPYMNGRLYGEDAVFCHYWREAGGSVWLDPELTLSHHGGGQSFPGHIGQWLKARQK